jgi:hypothetical protein
VGRVEGDVIRAGEAKAGPFRSKRRWLRFSLPTMLVFALLASVLVCWFAAEIRPQASEKATREAHAKVQQELEHKGVGSLYASLFCQKTPDPFIVPPLSFPYNTRRTALS